MFKDVGTEEGADRLLGSLVAEDSTELNGLVDNYAFSQFPRLGRRIWVREVLDSVLATTGTSDRCSLRTDLTALERVDLRPMPVFLGYPRQGQRREPAIGF